MLAVGAPLSEDEMSGRLGVGAAEVASRVAALCGAGAVESGAAPDGFVRFRLTSEGRRRSAEVLRRERATLGDVLVSVLPEFERSNRDLKELLHRWQVKSLGTSQVANDHRDERYDEQILRELGGLVAAAGPWLERLANERRRYARYRDRIRSAVERAGRGEIDYVSGIRVDSVHSVWWQLHADLLGVLGRARADADV